MSPRLVVGANDFVESWLPERLGFIGLHLHTRRELCPTDHHGSGQSYALGSASRLTTWRLPCVMVTLILISARSFAPPDHHAISHRPVKECAAFLLFKAQVSILRLR